MEFGGGRLFSPKQMPPRVNVNIILWPTIKSEYVPDRGRARDGYGSKCSRQLRIRMAVCRVQMLQVSAAWHEIGIVFLEIILVLDWILYAVFFLHWRNFARRFWFLPRTLPFIRQFFFRCNGTSPAQEGISLSTSLTIFGGRFTN